MGLGQKQNDKDLNMWLFNQHWKLDYTASLPPIDINN